MKKFKNVKIFNGKHDCQFKLTLAENGLTEDKEKLLRWMLCGPEVVRAVAEFCLSCILRKEETSDFRHHEQTPAFQKRFLNHVNSTAEEFSYVGNSFRDFYGDDLVQISTRDIIDDAFVKTVRTIEFIYFNLFQVGVLLFYNNIKIYITDKNKNIKIKM